MKRNKIIATVLLFGTGFFSVFAEDADELPALINLDEVEVRATRETTALRRQPVSYTFIPAVTIERTNINSLGDLSAIVPNFVMPDYGARITSSIFVRGIGSRMGAPSVGLYVDDIPILDKSGFDFNFFDIRNIEFLRGPQGTLYGRNAIGGLIRINTLSPFDFQGTRLFASYGTANDQLFRLSHYRKLNENLAVSAAGYYHANDGFFRNKYIGEKDWQRSGGGRFRLQWRMNPLWNMNFSAVYDFTNQLAFPYAPFDIETGEIGAVNFNDEASYWRGIFNTGLTFQRRSENLLFTSATSFQHLDDRMRIDQDFTPEPIFALEQNQNINALTQEFVFRSRGTSNYQWVAGAFGFFQNSAVNAPLTFREGGLAIIQGHLDQAGANNPMMPRITVTSDEMLIPGIFDIPVRGFAVYHQSSYRFWDRLTLTAGIRLEYERTSMRYYTSAQMNVTVQPPMPPGAPPIIIPAVSGDTISGQLTQRFFDILPKIAVKYDINDRHSVYATISRGHKTGGFNFQMFGDILQQSLMNQSDSDDVDFKDIIAYRPEFTINYEIGLRSELIRNRLFADLAFFYIDYTDQQIVTFSSANIGARRMENAGRSRSFGAEASIRARITDNFNLNIACGFTHATFIDYQADEDTNFAGNFLPLVPRNTLSAGFEYNLQVQNAFWNNVVFRAQYNGVGKIYFTEENLVSQNFYGILNGSISFVRGAFSLNFWTKNALDTQFKTFYFTSLNRDFVQRGRPRQVGVSIQHSF